MTPTTFTPQTVSTESYLDWLDQCDHRHGGLSGQPSDSKSDPDPHCPGSGHKRKRERDPKVPQGCVQAPHSPHSAHWPSYHSKIHVKTETYDLINLHGKLSGQLSVTVAGPFVQQAVTGQVLVRERVPVVPQTAVQGLQVPSSFQSPKVPQTVSSESYLNCIHQ